MANQKQGTVKRLKMSERAQQQLDLHFPGIDARVLWRRKTNDGYTTLPRTMPIVMQAIDAQTKGQPAGHTLFCLWARSPDHPFVTIENPATFASEAGFEGERAVDTWRRRMKQLHELNFIAPKKGPSGDFHYVLLLNPNTAVEWMRTRGLVQDGLYARFIDRVNDVGAQGDIDAIRAYWQEQVAATAVANAANTGGVTPSTAADLPPASVTVVNVSAQPVPPAPAAPLNAPSAVAPTNLVK